MVAAVTAKRCFEENVRLFADARSEPEKYNLYNGLANLAEALASVHSKLDDLDRRLRQIEGRL